MNVSGALSAEDAAILTALLAKTKSVDEVEAAFQIFSDSRRSFRPPIAFHETCSD